MKISKRGPFLLFALALLALGSRAQDCTDTVPPGGFSCAEQRDFGKCEAEWMIDGDFCAQTCGRCSTAPPPSPPVAEVESVTEAPVAEAPSAASPGQTVVSLLLPAAEPLVPAPEPEVEPLPLLPPRVRTPEVAAPAPVLEPLVGLPELPLPEAPAPELEAPLVEPPVEAPVVAPTPAPELEQVTSVLQPLVCQPGDLVESLNTTSDLSTLLRLLVAANVTIPTNVTILAPNNAAFESLLANLGLEESDLLANTTALASILLFHVIPDGALSGPELVDTGRFSTALGLPVTFSQDEGQLQVRGGISFARTIGVSSLCGPPRANVFVIDSVLLPGSDLSNLPPAPGSVPPSRRQPTCPSLSAPEALRAVGASALLDVIVALNLAGSLPNQATIFVPPSAELRATLEALGVTSLSDAAANQTLADTLRSVILYHVVPDRLVEDSDFRDGLQLDTASEGRQLFIETTGDETTYDLVTLTGERANFVTEVYNESCNYVLHGVDRVLLYSSEILPAPPTAPPPTAEEVFTIAPVSEDDELVTPPPQDTSLLFCNSIYQIVSVNSLLTNFTAFVRAANLESVFSNKSSTFTVFAPTDEAFGVLAGRLGVNTSDFLTNTTQLASLLAYHTAISGVSANDFFNGQRLRTAALDSQRRPLSLNISLAGNDNIIVRGNGSAANVVRRNLQACRSYINIIDNVLIPFPLNVTAANITAPTGLPGRPADLSPLRPSAGIGLGLGPRAPTPGAGSAITGGTSRPRPAGSAARPTALAPAPETEAPVAEAPAELVVEAPLGSDFVGLLPEAPAEAPLAAEAPLIEPPVLLPLAPVAEAPLEASAEIPIEAPAEAPLLVQTVGGRRGRAGANRN